MALLEEYRYPIFSKLVYLSTTVKDILLPVIQVNNLATFKKIYIRKNQLIMTFFKYPLFHKTCFSDPHSLNPDPNPSIF
jgi:hypothetical protein